MHGYSVLFFFLFFFLYSSISVFHSFDVSFHFSFFSEIQIKFYAKKKYMSEHEKKGMLDERKEKLSISLKI